MKKLMFATALVASVAAFADAAPTAINAINFAGYATGATFQNYDPELNSEENTGPFFYFQGEAGVSNSSVVTNESASANHTAFFADATDSNYLALDTEGGTFWRGLNQAKRTEEGETVTYGLGDPRAIAATGTYLDTLVQFTVTEDDAPTLGGDDKLAIWLQAGEGTTNLMVKAAVVDEGGGRTETAFTVSGTTVEPGTWYRLTVKAVADITDTDEIPGFQIFLNGTVIAADKPTLTAGYLELIESDSHHADIVAGKYFASPKTVATLQGVGFQGTGAVDEIVWTEDDLFPAGGPTVVDYTFTLTLDANVTAAVTTNGAAVALDANNQAQILEGTTVTIAEPTFATGYQLSTVTTNGTTVVSPTFPLSFTMDAAMTVAITSELIPATYPDYVGEDAALKTQYDAWKQAVGFDDSSTSTHKNQFLLNVDEETTVGDDALQIDSITEVQGGWKIVVSTTVSGAALSTGTESFTASYNGYLTVLAADTLEGLSSATGVAYPVTAIEGGKVEITVTAGKFMKVQLTTTPGAAPAAAGN